MLIKENDSEPLDVRLEVTLNEGDSVISSKDVITSENAEWSKHSLCRINALDSDLMIN